MTKKDFITVSSVLFNHISLCKGLLAANSQSEYYRGQLNGLEILTKELAKEFARINPRFDYDKFYQACGIQQ